MFKSKVVAVAAPISVAISLILGAGAVQASSHGGPKYVGSGKGEAVMSGAGECVNAMGGTAPVGTCGAKPMMKKEEPAADSDGDGVPDSRDECPATPKGVKVTSYGCPKDSDGDGVADYLDKCPGTPAGARVNDEGCELAAQGTKVINLVEDEFDFDSAKLKPGMESALSDVAAEVNATAGTESLSIVGHTDSTGPADYNQGLSERRAQAVADFLAGQGVPASAMSVMGKGETDPIADNSTRDGRAANRRVEITTN